MIFFRPGSQVHRLTAVIAATGEIPVSALYLFGNHRSMRDLITRLTEVQDYRNTETGETVRCRLLTLIGKGRAKAVRLLKGGLPVLSWIGARAYYEATFRGNNFPSDPTHREPNFRFAEAALMLMRAGVEIRPWRTPPLQGELGIALLPPDASLYSSRDLKGLRDGEMKKTQYARLTGAIFSQYGAVTIYNSRNALIKWNGMSEYKTLHSIIELARMNTQSETVDSMILFVKSEDVAVRTIEAMRKTKRLELQLDNIYRHIHFVPLNENGIDQLRLLLLPDWNERLLSALFSPEQRSFNQGIFEYDAIVDGAFIFVFFDGDIARLIHFQTGSSGRSDRCVLLCFPFQVGLVRHVLGASVCIKTIEAGMILDALGADRRTIFDAEA